MNTVHEVYILNGSVMQADSRVPAFYNRAFCYGDGLFETMRCFNGHIAFLKDHLIRLQAGMKALKMNIPKGVDEKGLTTQIKKLMPLNAFSGLTRIRLQVWRNDGGFYTPDTNDSSYIITVSRFAKTTFERKGLRIGIYESVSLVPGLFSPFKTCNSIPYVMAGLYAKKMKLDDCLLLNNKGHVTESVASNLFWIKNENVFTPPLSDGCIAGVMRKNLRRYMKKKGLQVAEKSITIKELERVDELFLTNVSNGIRWVSTLNGIKLKNEFSKNLFLELPMLDASFRQG